MSGPDILREAMHPANTVTREDALTRYTRNVQMWMTVRQEASQLAPAEIEIVEHFWRESRRTDECADAIQADRQMMAQFEGASCH